MLAAVMVMTSAAVWMGNEKQAEAAASFKVHFIEVGTGDGALLQYGSGKSAKYALIDAGPQTTQLLGGKATGSVTKKTDYLINNNKNSASSKNKKAMELSIPIITEEEFMDMIK